MPNEKKLRRKIEKYEDRINRLYREMSKSRSRSRSRSRLRNPSPSPNRSEVPEYVEEGCYNVEELEAETNTANEPCSASQQSVDDNNQIDAFRDALGADYGDDDSKFDGKIQTEISKRWNHILVNGLTKEEKDEILKKYKLPENCQLLEAPVLNEEVKSVMTENSKIRDQSLEIVQHQLGVATSIVGHVMTNLIENKEINKIQLVSKLTDASKLLNDINFHKTKTRRILIAPLLDKNFNHLIEKVKRDEHLFGIDLGAKIKTSQELKKSSSQIKKPMFVSRPTSNKPATKFRAVGNRYGPPQNQPSLQTKAAAPRGGPRSRATQPPRQRAGSSYGRSRSERAAPRGPHSRR